LILVDGCAIVDRKGCRLPAFSFKPMPITTTVAPSYAWRMIFIGVLCAVFGVWGAYDLWVKIPRQERNFEQFRTIDAEIKKLEEKQTAARRTGRNLSPEELVNLDQAKTQLTALMPRGAPPEAPSKFNKATQWAYILCLPCAPYFFLLVKRVRKQMYSLDEEGNLGFVNDDAQGSSTWKRDEIADIDMGIWMRKSIAHVVHVDGTRLKLDAYLHKNLDKIIGLIANRLHADQWDPEAKPIKPVEDEIADELESPAEEAVSG
jgi:hypothetical protein